MSLVRIVCLTLLIAGLGEALPARANDAAALHVPRGAGARSEGEPGRKYAPDRQVDILHLKLDVTPDFEGRTIEATATLSFVPISAAVERLVLDAVDLNIEEVQATPEVRDVYVGPETLELTFAEPLAMGDEGRVMVVYSAEPQKGLYFRTPALGYPEGDEHLWTQGETHEARYWYPSVDYPNERFSSEVICRLPEGMVALSNGRLLSKEADDGGRVAWHWIQEKSHPNYLVALVAGNLTGLKDQHGKIPMAFWTPPSQAHLAERAYGETPRIMGFLEEEIGVEFPWVKYDQAAVQDFLYGGMENTTLTILTDRILYPAEVENVRESTGLVAHELAHQWFGNYVTCKDWSHAWLNEGFATFYTWLYEGERDGETAMRYALWGAARGIAGRKDDTRPIVDREYKRAFEQFSFRAYQKGGWVLQMLREELGEATFRQGVRLYLERNALDSVVTADLIEALEEVSGRSLDAYFDQWVYHAGIPRLDVRYHWNGATQQARLTVRQTQDVSEDVLLFDVPLTVRFSGEGWSHEETVRIRDRDEDFYFPLERAPEVIHLNPYEGLLAEINFNPGRAMRLAQLRDGEDALARAKAAHALGGSKDAVAVQALKEALGADAFYGARIEAARALGRMGTDEALQALAESPKQPDARVRLAVVEALAGFYDPRARERLTEVVETGSNPYILAAAIRGLGRYPDEAIDGVLKAKLKGESHRQMVARAAMEAARSRDAGSLTGEVLRLLKEGRARFPRDVYGRGLEVLGFLARDEAQRDAAREFLYESLEAPVDRIVIGALRGLGDLGDASALAIVEAFAGEGHPNAVRKAARQAAQKLRSEKPAEPRLRDLRQEVLDLKEESSKLKEQLEALEKRFEAGRPGDREKERRFLGIF